MPYNPNERLPRQPWDPTEGAFGCCYCQTPLAERDPHVLSCYDGRVMCPPCYLAHQEGREQRLYDRAGARKSLGLSPDPSGQIAEALALVKSGAARDVLAARDLVAARRAGA